MESRFLTLSGSIFMEAAGGSAYAFSVYSPQLKEALNFTQSSIQDVASIGNFGLYFAVIPGFAYDAFGPSFVTAVGCILCGLGYALMWGGASSRVANTPAAMAVYAILWNHGSGWLDTAAVATNIRNFPNNRGLVSGLMKSFFGLSASLLTLVYTSWFKPNVIEYLLFCTFAIPVLAGLGGLVCRLVSLEDAQKLVSPEQVSKLFTGYGVVIITAAYLAVVSLLQAQQVIATNHGYVYALIPLMLFHTAYAIPWRWAQISKDAKGQPLLVQDHEGDVVNMPGDEEAQTEVIRPMSDPKPGKHQYRKSHYFRVVAAAARKRKISGATWCEGVLSLDFALIFFILMVGPGSGLVMINNVGNLVISLGGSNDQQDVYVTLLSVFNCVGRMIFGYFSDYASSRLSRAGWLTVCVGGMMCAQLLSAFSNLQMLYGSVMLVGTFYGGFFSLGPALGIERFGQRAFASIFLLSSLGTAFASYLLSALMASRLYESHIIGNTTQCYGNICYRISFLIVACICFVATLAGVWLTRRLRPLYVGPNGTAIDYDAFAKAYAPTRGMELLRTTVRPRCCCRCGRDMIAYDEDEEELPRPPSDEEVSLLARAEPADFQLAATEQLPAADREVKLTAAQKAVSTPHLNRSAAPVMSLNAGAAGNARPGTSFATPATTDNAPAFEGDDPFYS